MTEEIEKKEPSDNHIYQWISFYRDTFEFYLSSIQFYISLLERDIKSIESDPDLKLILDEETLSSFKIEHELARMKRTEKWMADEFEKCGEDSFDCDFMNVSHGFIRHLKSVGMLYIKHLELRRNKIASRANVSKYALQAVDSRILQFQEKLNIGVFSDATPLPLLVDEAVSASSFQNEEQDIVDNMNYKDEALANVTRSRPVLLESIEIIDKELRKRCLDLFDSFLRDGSHERLDTVVSEATRILEDRLRTLSNAKEDSIGVDLAKYAFSAASPVLKISDVPAEQEAVHLLFRGVFGSIRNPSHHQLMGKLSPERVLQIMGFIDYLIHLCESAEFVHSEEMPE